MKAAQQLGDMHHAVVAVYELGGEASPAEVAMQLRWTADDRRVDEQRAETALLAAQDHGYIGERL